MSDIEIMSLDEAKKSLFAHDFVERRDKKLTEFRDQITAESLTEAMRILFNPGGSTNMMLSARDDRFEHVELASGLQIPCESERDALNQLYAMLLGLKVGWGDKGTVFVRSAPYTQENEGRWKARCRLFFLRSPS